MRPKDDMLSRWPWGAQGTGRKYAGRPGGSGRVGPQPPQRPLFWWAGVEQVRGQGGRQGCRGQPHVPGARSPRGFVIPGPLSVTPTGSCTLGPLWSGASRSRDTRRPGASLSLCSHSTAQHSTGFPHPVRWACNCVGAGLGPPPSTAVPSPG